MRVNFSLTQIFSFIINTTNLINKLRKFPKHRVHMKVILGIFRNQRKAQTNIIIYLQLLIRRRFSLMKKIRKQLKPINFLIHNQKLFMIPVILKYIFQRQSKPLSSRNTLLLFSKFQQLKSLQTKLNNRVFLNQMFLNFSLLIHKST